MLDREVRAEFESAHVGIDRQRESRGNYASHQTGQWG
jgi:hypothetical protein